MVLGPSIRNIPPTSIVIIPYSAKQLVTTAPHSSLKSAPPYGGGVSCSVAVAGRLPVAQQQGWEGRVLGATRTTHNHDFSPVEIPENGGGRRAIDRTSWRFWLSLAVYTILRPPEHAIGG